MKSWPQNTIALICCRVGDPYWNGKEGSEERNCFYCDHKIMASPDSIQNKAAVSSEFVCIECYRENTDGKPHLLLRSPERAREPQMSTPLVYNDKEILQLRRFAEQNPFSAEDCKKIIEGKALAPGDLPGYTIYLEPCWKLVYSIGDYPNRSGGTTRVRHMSMSLTKPGRVPNMTVIEILSKSLGFPELKECHITCENEIVEVMAEL